MEKYLRDRFKIPVVLIVVNGGPGTLETVGEGDILHIFSSHVLILLAAAKNKFAIVVVQGSGRACDAIAALVRRAKLNESLPEKARGTTQSFSTSIISLNLLK